MDYSMILWGLLALVGASIGSFITLVTYRLPRAEPIGLTRSRCPACLKSLQPIDLMPVLSWVLHRGRCRQCKASVSMRYPLTELACAIGAVLLLRRFGFTLEAYALVGLWWCIVAIIVTDLEHYIILDEAQIVMIILGVLYHYTLGTDPAAVITAACVGLAIGLTLKYGFIYLRNKDGLGMGDVKLLFVVGIWLAAWPSFVPYLFFSGVLGIMCGLAWRLAGRGERFPFGPALVISLLACVIWPQTANGFWQLYGLLGLVH
jgi:leader peptidase (prepilin peptidase) / N-methyltransferase